MAKSFSTLGKFKQVDVGEANDAYDFEAALEGDDLETFFGDEPETIAVLKGDVKVKGPVSLGSEEPGVWVVDGNLSVDGVLTFNASDNHNVLLVTGDLECDGLSVSWEADLLVLGSLKVKGVFLSSNSDGGQTIVHGTENSMAAVILTNHGSPRFLDESFKPTLINGWSDFPRKGVLPRATALAPPFNAETDRPHENLVKALIAGAPILA